MRIIAMVVSKDEASRYWDLFLAWTKTFVDEVVVYDDQSTDGTASVAIDQGCLTAVRFDDDPSFLEHEGRFRANAWRWMETAAEPDEGDWILSLDADEFYVDHRGPRIGLVVDAEDALGLGWNALGFKIVEIFGEQEGYFQQRVDGFWDQIQGVRMVRWEPGGTFAERKMGSGSLPTYARPTLVAGGQILHVGYLNDADKAAKHERYAALPGHSSAHVASIVQEGTLVPYRGPYPFA